MGKITKGYVNPSCISLHQNDCIKMVIIVDYVFITISLCQKQHTLQMLSSYEHSLLGMVDSRRRDSARRWWGTRQVLGSNSSQHLRASLNEHLSCVFLPSFGFKGLPVWSPLVSSGVLASIVLSLTQRPIGWMLVKSYVLNRVGDI